ncbi:MAG: EpsI family protein [Gemmatimonadota bacterium]|nr:EpsI family protein [Gemmatimonadota bacterium]
MSASRSHWTPVAILLVGCILLGGTHRQMELPLRAPLSSALPADVLGLTGRSATISDAEAAVAGFTDYALRIYEPAAGDGDGPDPSRWASVYVGFYSRQTRGKTIHSPRNCLPGAGWEELSSGTHTLSIPGSEVQVNQYLLQNGSTQALVLYWYQGRGRVAFNEYLVKWNLLVDAAVRRRTDEALVRIVVPVVESVDASLREASEIATELIRPVAGVLPAP